MTLTGFIKYVWLSEDSESVDDLTKQLRKAQKVPRLPWERLIEGRTEISLNERDVESLVAMMEAFPDQALFRLPEESGETDGVHPPLRQRILYLWKNRREIEAAARKTGRL
ncbi:MAG: hypothetical protein QM775_20850 [Pirellulales bacterium]